MRTSEHSGCYKKGRVFSRPIWGLNPQNWMINDNHQKLAHLDERLRFSRQNQPKIGVRVTKIGGLSAGKDVNQWVSILEGIWMRERESERPQGRPPQCWPYINSQKDRTIPFLNSVNIQKDVEHLP